MHESFHVDDPPRFTARGSAGPTASLRRPSGGSAATSPASSRRSCRRRRLAPPQGDVLVGGLRPGGGAEEFAMIRDIGLTLFDCSCCGRASSRTPDRVNVTANRRPADGLRHRRRTGLLLQPTFFTGQWRANWARTGSSTRPTAATRRSPAREPRAARGSPTTSTTSTPRHSSSRRRTSCSGRSAAPGVRDHPAILGVGASGLQARPVRRATDSEG